MKIKIKIKTVKNKEKEITVNESDTIGQIRNQVKGAPGFGGIKKLVYRGNKVDDETITVIFLLLTLFECEFFCGPRADRRF